MMRPLAFVALSAWTGSMLLLSELARFRRPDRVARIAAHLPGRLDQRTAPREGLLDVFAPLARDLGAAVARAFGVEEDLALRLERTHSTLGPTEFRVRQVSIALAITVATVVTTMVVSPPVPLTVIACMGAPLLALLAHEAVIAKHSDEHKRALLLELPIVSEQLGMLLSSGWSLNAAIDRIAARSGGAIALDLRRVIGRVQQGLTEEQALREWATIADVAAVDRLVSVISLHHETADLGRLITEEARATRAEAHRELIERIEKRSQQVWIPVTVATLVPGVLFLAVPFTAALRLFSSA